MFVFNLRRRELLKDFQQKPQTHREASLWMKSSLLWTAYRHLYELPRQEEQLWSKAIPAKTMTPESRSLSSFIIL